MKIHLIKERPIIGDPIDVKKLMNWIIFGDPNKPYTTYDNEGF